MAGRIGSTSPMPMNETTQANATAKTAFGCRNGLATEPLIGVLQSSDPPSPAPTPGRWPRAPPPRAARRGARGVGPGSGPRGLGALDVGRGAGRRRLGAFDVGQGVHGRQGRC